MSMHNVFCKFVSAEQHLFVKIIVFHVNKAVSFCVRLFFHWNLEESMSSTTEEELKLVKIQTNTDSTTNPSFYTTHSENQTAIEYLVEFIDSRESLDIYQFLAIYGWKHRDFEDLFRAITCLIAQILGITLIREEIIEDNDTLKISHFDFAFNEYS